MPATPSHLAEAPAPVVGASVIGLWTPAPAPCVGATGTLASAGRRKPS
ncbi:MAG TPA: hypothetical protein VHH36_05995 [Candidatus Thermoplasmatota archaeon]|nr:hypothetical protein [Candidatus Thermoplasmatota archaeon]